MSFIPTLKTSIDLTARSRETGKPDKIEGMGRTGRLTEKNMTNSRVRFNNNSINKSRESISLSQNERLRRKKEALDFLRKETKTGTTSATTTGNGTRLGGYSGVRNNDNNIRRIRDPNSIKTYELLGENPIERIPGLASQRAMYDDNAIRNIARESRRRNPLNQESPTKTFPRIFDESSRVSKTYKRYSSKNNGLLNSLSNFGSKVFRSILYSEEYTNPKDTDNKILSDLTYSNLEMQRKHFLESEMRQKELDMRLKEKEKYLGQLNDKINFTEQLKPNASSNTMLDQSRSIDKQMEKLDSRLQNILEEVNSSSTTKLLSELENIKGELTTLRRKQESNNIKFESKFEDMKLENQLNRQKFDRLFSDLEEKRRALDMEKDSLIKMLQSQPANNIKNQLDLTSSLESFISEKESAGNDIEHKLKRKLNNLNKNDQDYKNNNDADISDEHDNDEYNFSDDDDDDDARDILKYIMMNKKRNVDIKAERMKNRTRRIKSNLNRIEKTAKQTKT